MRCDAQPPSRTSRQKPKHTCSILKALCDDDAKMIHVYLGLSFTICFSGVRTFCFTAQFFLRNQNNRAIAVRGGSAHSYSLVEKTSELNERHTWLYNAYFVQKKLLLDFFSFSVAHCPPCCILSTGFFYTNIWYDVRGQWYQSWTKLSSLPELAQYTPPTPTQCNSTVASRRQWVLGIKLLIRRLSRSSDDVKLRLMKQHSWRLCLA